MSAAGAITVEHVEVLWRARNRNPITAQAYARDETILLGWAMGEVFEDFRMLVEAWVLAVDTHDAERRAGRQVERRRLHLPESLDGQWFVDGELDPVSGDAVASVLDRIVAERYARDRAEARARLGAAARVLDDAVIERVIFDAPDRVRSVSYRRTFRDALRRAVEVKQTRCGHGYRRRRVELCEADHLEPHGRGGPTSEENGRLLCGFHNRLRDIHDDGGAAGLITPRRVRRTRPR